MPEGLRLIGFTAVQAPRLFPCAAGGHLSDRSPERTVRFISSCSRSSSEFLRSLSRPFPFGIRLAARVSSLFATSPGASTHLEGSQVLDTFRPQAFSASRRLSPHTSFAGLFHPAAASRVICSFRGLPSLRSRRFPRRNRAAPLPLFSGRSPDRSLESTCRRPRLRGLHPRRARTAEGR